MARETRYVGMLGDWQRLHGLVEANRAELPQLEPYLAKLKTIIDRALEVTKQQGSMRAAKQAASKEIRKLSGDGNRVAALMRQALKEHYGISEEKLAEFGLQPFRGRTRPRPETPQAPQEPGSPGTTPPDIPDPEQPVEP